jgi:predicted secreted protein
MRRTLAIALALAASPAWAQTPPPTSQTILALSATADIPVTPDRLTATLQATAVAATPAAASAALNHLVAEARKTAQSIPTVRMDAQTYQVTRHDPPDQRWQADQTITLTAQDGTDAVLRLTALLQQQNLITQDISWQVASTTLQQHQAEAVQTALHSLRQAATADATALSLHFAGFRTVSIDDATSRPVPMMHAMLARAAAPQVDQPTDASISATVHGEAILTQ